MVDVRGVEVDVKPLVKALRAVEGGVDDLKGVHGEAAAVLKSGAVPPRVTGRLAASGRVSAQQRTGVVRYGRKSVPYAAVIHWGWASRNIRAQPFLADARDRREQAVVEVYRDGIEDVMRRHGLDTH